MYSFDFVKATTIADAAKAHIALEARLTTGSTVLKI